MLEKDIKHMMQHGETGAPLPRHLARQIGKKCCDNHNNNGAVTGWVNPRTGKALDRTGTFQVFDRTTGKRLVKEIASKG